MLSLAALTISKTFSFNDEQKYLSRNLQMFQGIQDYRADTNITIKIQQLFLILLIILKALKSFLSEFAKEARSYKKRILIFGAMRDKDN